jgi:spore maturation protein CgeB
MSTNKAKVLVLDTYYPDFIQSIAPSLAGDDYDEALAKTLATQFGTGDSYSYWLARHGWNTCDVIGNFGLLQKKYIEKYARWDYSGDKSAVIEQIRQFDPDVLFLQDLSFFTPADIRFIRQELHVNLIAAQCSCPLPGNEQIQMCDVIFTSFPHYLEIFEKLGVKGVYSKLAFEDRILEKVKPKEPRINGAVFVGGVGYPSHWQYGLEVLEAIAQQVESFSWYGYGADLLPDSMVLKRRYKGQAWGLQMYQILADHSIVINRHGEVAKDYANNMKLFETTGMGALLVTDHKKNLGEMFINGEEIASYSSAQDAADTVGLYLADPARAREIATKGQVRTLLEHTYDKKMEEIGKVMGEML